MFSPGTWTSLCEQQETRSLAKLSSSLPWVWGEGNRKCHLGRRMTDESFPFMRLRMLALICCRVSPWLKCALSVRACVRWTKECKEREESLRVQWVRFLAVIYVSLFCVSWKGPTQSSKHQQESRLLHDAQQICDQGEDQDTLWLRRLAKSFSEVTKSEDATTMHWATDPPVGGQLFQLGSHVSSKVWNKVEGWVKSAETLAGTSSYRAACIR